MRSSRSNPIQTKNKKNKKPKKKTKELKTKNKHKASCSSQSNAAHPVALTKAQQKVVDDIKKFGRLPKKNTGDSEEDKLEYKLYWRYYNHKKDLPENILQDLFLLQDKAEALHNCNRQPLPDGVLLSMC